MVYCLDVVVANVCFVFTRDLLLMCILFVGDYVDECKTGPSIMCGPDFVCQNTVGSYKCVCYNGYFMNDTHCKGIRSMYLFNSISHKKAFQ